MASWPSRISTHIICSLDNEKFFAGEKILSCSGAAKSSAAVGPLIDLANLLSVHIELDAAEAKTVATASSH
jgi:hypothetical protein